MLNLNEIRVGNLIQRVVPYKVVRMLASGEIDACELLDKTGKVYYFLIQDFTGIPVSEGWMEHFGFTLQSDAYSHPSTNQILHRKDALVYTTNGTHIQYVHQLQNWLSDVANKF